jgi:hypothetical protein
MWYVMDEGKAKFWTYGRSQKILNLERDPRITCLVETGEEYGDLKGVELVGRGEVITDREQVLAAGFKVVERYFGLVGEDGRPFVEQTGAKRHLVVVHPDRVVSWDHGKLGGGF